MNPSWRVDVGDCRELLRAMPADSVHCVCTSPPYYGLRSYGLAPSVFGGEPGCEHDWDEATASRSARAYEGLAEWSAENARGGAHTPAEQGYEAATAACRRCGAWRGELGHEPTPDLYIEHLVEIFREVKRVLRPDGVCWLNLGDSYSAGARQTADPDERVGGRGLDNIRPGPGNAKAKDLLMVPARAAIALRNDGWYLRAEVVWAKPNALPDSVTDRPTRDHENVYLLSRSERYAYDAEAVRIEAASDYRRGDVGGRGEQLWSGGSNGANPQSDHSGWIGGEPGSRSLRTVWSVPTQPYADAHFAVWPPALVEPMVKAGAPEGGCCSACGAPRVRLIVREKHPERDPEAQRALDAERTGRTDGKVAGPGGMLDDSRTVGWRPSCACGAPAGVRPDDMDVIATPLGRRGGDPSLEVGRAGFARPRDAAEGTRLITRYEQRRHAEQIRDLDTVPDHRQEYLIGNINGHDLPDGLRVTLEAWLHYVRTDRRGARPVPPDLLSWLLDVGLVEQVEVPGWEPPEAVPCTVMDPFSGSGTTGMVALRLGRSYVGLELGEEYAELSKRRILSDAPLMNQPAYVGADAI